MKNNMSNHNRCKDKKEGNKVKNKIYYARTYRHLEASKTETLLFFLLLVLPALIVLLHYYDELTLVMVRVTSWILEQAGAIAEPIIEASDFIPKLGSVYYLSLPTVYINYSFILINLAVCLILLWALSAGPMKGRPVVIYLTIVLLTHIIACVFFLFGSELFSYTTTEFSELYVKQQVGIWITFLALIGLVMGVLGRQHLIRRILTVICVELYSFLFGVVRYTLFMWILTKFSVLYTPLMFFVLGPFFDFLYFVLIYSISLNGVIKKYQGEDRGKWVWA